MVSSLYSSVVASAVLSFAALRVNAFDNSRFDNFVAYWGQNSYGAANSADVANWQKNISFYCDDVDVLPIAFMNTYFGTGNLPAINLANTCNTQDNSVFAGSELLNCQFMADDIKACQAKGAAVTLSMGGATGSNTFGSDEQAQQFADLVWDLFLGGNSSTRPFGDAVLDGVDLDIEGGGPTGYAAFVTQLRTHFQGANKKYIVSAAPQCIYPDQNLGAVLDNAEFDAVYVQFYNNPCGLNKADDFSWWNFGSWDYWATQVSPNKNVKVYIGAPASTTAAGSGYLAPDDLAKVAAEMRANYSSFGGVMVWDASQAYANNRFDKSIKDALVAAGGTGFTFPACNAPAWQQGTSYSGGATVSYQNYIWRAKYSAQDQPKIGDLGDWMPISACGGTNIPSGPGSGGGESGSSSAPPSSTVSSSSTVAQPPTTTTTVAPSSTADPSSDPCNSDTPTTTVTTSTPTPSSTEDPCSTDTPTPSSTGASPSGGACGSAKEYDAGTVYTGGQSVSYQGHVWTAKWWTLGEAPSTGGSGVWTDGGACSSKRDEPRQTPPPASRPTQSISNRNQLRRDPNRL